ncbi:MAG: sensor domain-containing diguanylate cyclase [Solirubrobacteraceae bacterium]
MAVVNAWFELKQNGMAETQARLRSDPHTWRSVRMLDLRTTHDVILTIGWPSEDPPSGLASREGEGVVSSTPRFSTRKQDGEGNVTECDPAYLEMFGYAGKAEVIGHPTFERVHPDDQARLIESWVAMVATRRPQMTRVRMRRGDESWLWVDTTYHNYLGEEGEGYVLAECIDVSAEMAAQDALQDREALLRRLIEEMPDGLLQLDAARSVVYHNSQLLGLLAMAGLDAAAERPPTIETLLGAFSAQSASRLRAAIDAALLQAERADVELEACPADGETRHLLFKVRPLLRDDAMVSGVIAAVQDVTEAARARRDLERQASTDPLTGAHNRSATITALQTELQKREAVGVAYIDLDRFKQVNDRFGHATGDEVLLEATRRLRRAMREHDVLGRLGGDEFLVILPRVGTRDAAMAAARRIAQGLCGTYQLDAGGIELSASVGVAFSEDAGLPAERLIERADHAMYDSKRERRGVPCLAPAA